MSYLKRATRKILRSLNPNWEFQAVEQYHFNKLDRKPPELCWQALPPLPEGQLDVGAAQFGHQLYMFGGFLWGGKVKASVSVYDLRRLRLTDQIPFPENLAQTHLGVANDGQRFIYLISGQLGTCCSPATRNCFVFDTQDRTWREFPSLPYARYAPATQILNGRLHVFAGAKEDRTTSSIDHWSIPILNGQALENTWQEEPPVPKGGPHRGSIIYQNFIYVFGGQEGDYVAIPGDPQFTCTWTLTEETRLPNVYRYSPQDKHWERLADMPVPVSHTESTTLHIGDYVIFPGGDDARVGKTDVVTTVDVIQAYHLPSNRWKIVGRLPYGLKSFVAAYYHQHIYLLGGQRAISHQNPKTMDRYERSAWKARIDPKIFSEFFT